MKILYFICSALLVVPVVAMANTGCPILHAHYKYGWNGGVADFGMSRAVNGQKSKLSLHLSLEGAGDLWFLFDQGSARLISLISTEDIHSPTWTPPDPDSQKGRPIADQQFFAWNDDLKVVGDAPLKDTVAPEYFLIPGLPETLQFGRGRSVIIGAGIFKFNYCGK